MQNEIFLCDRCKRKLVRHPFVKMKRTLLVEHIFGFGPYDYVNEQYDLCPKCAREFERDFMHMKPDVPQEDDIP